MQNSIRHLAQLIQEAQNIVFFGGAGVSTESGIPDFRSVDGLYHQKFDYPPETILSHSFFVQKPTEFYSFYKEKMLFDPKCIRPNAAHFSLAEIEEAKEAEGGSLHVVTQNVDGLHTLAGSLNVHELHGSIHRNYCTHCGAFYPLSHVVESVGIPRCTCGGIVKPDVVLYQEALDNQTVMAAIDAIATADLLIIGGTSMTVYPAAGLIRYFRGQHLVVINRDATSADDEAELVIRSPIGEVFSGVMEQLS